MKQNIRVHTQTRSSNKRPFLCDHHFHVVHIAQRVIPGVMVCESCGQRLVLRKPSRVSLHNRM
jgi:hypothetical protein